MSEVSSARKRGLRALLSVSSPVPSATARVYCSGTRRVCKTARVYAGVKQGRGEKEREKESGFGAGRREKESEQEGIREGGEKVTVACRRVLNVASGRPVWPVARGPGLRSRPRCRPVAPVESKREATRLEGLTRGRGRERARGRGWAGRRRVLPSRYSLPPPSWTLPKGFYPSSSSYSSFSFAHTRTHGRGSIFVLFGDRSVT